MAHNHGSSDGHNHAAPTSFGRAFAVGIALNSTFVVEFLYGIRGNSLSLIADAGHNLSDVLGLTLAWAQSGSPNGRRPKNALTVIAARRF